MLALHARLCTHDTGVVIEPVGEAPVSLNGRPITVANPRRLQSLEASLVAVLPIEIDESQSFQAAKRDLEAELRGW